MSWASRTSAASASWRCSRRHDLVGLEAEVGELEIGAARARDAAAPSEPAWRPRGARPSARARRRGGGARHPAPRRDLRGAGGAGRRRAGQPRPGPASRPRLLHGGDPRGLRPGAGPRARRRRSIRRADGPLRAAAAGRGLRALPGAGAHRPGRGGAAWREEVDEARGELAEVSGRAPDGRAEARRPAGGAVRGHARAPRQDRGRHRRAARRLALAGLRRRRAGAGHHAALRRPDLRRGGSRRPRDHRQGRAARAARPRRVRAPRPRLRRLPDGARRAQGRREPRRGRAAPRGDADRDQVPADGRALLRADAAARPR